MTPVKIHTISNKIKCRIWKISFHYLLIILKSKIHKGKMSMSRSFQFFILARDNPIVAYETQYTLDITMANDPEVASMIYGLRCVGGSMAVHGYIVFNLEKELTMVQVLLSGCNVRISNYNQNNNLYGYLKYHSICIKTWWTTYDWEMNPHLVLDVEWHHFNADTNQHLWNGE